MMIEVGYSCRSDSYSVLVVFRFENRFLVQHHDFFKSLNVKILQFIVWNRVEMVARGVYKEQKITGSIAIYINVNHLSSEDNTRDC